MAADGSDDTLRLSIRAALAAAPGMASESAERIDLLVAEFLPFARCVAHEAVIGPEARSLAWLFAYRLGDQGISALATTAAMVAWRDAMATDEARACADQVLPLLLDGYARAREDRARAELQRALGESLLVTELARGVVLVIAAGQMDPDAGRTLADRAGQLMLRRDARAVLLELSGLHDPDAATVSELWAITSSARMLGAHAVAVGESSTITAALAGASVSMAGVRRAPTLAAGLELLARECGVTLTSDRAWLAWAYELLRSRVGRT